MKRLIHNLLLSILLVSLSATAVSCSDSKGGKKNFPSDAAGKTRVRFISSWGGVDSKAEALRELFKRFQSDNPDIEVVNESLFGEDFLPKIKTDFASGNNPDVFGLWPGSDIRALIKADKVADLTSTLNEDKQWKDTFDSKMWSYTAYDGRIYGLPVETIFECLFINRDIFEKFDVKIPETYEEFKQAIVTIKQHNIIPIAYNTEAEGTYLYQNLVCALAGKDIIEHPSSSGDYIKYSVQAMDYMKELYDMDAFPPNSFTLSNNERNIMFRDKKAAMIVQGSWFIGNLKDIESTVEVIPFPRINGGNAKGSTMIFGLGCGNFHISRTAFEGGKKDASLRLLRYITSKYAASYLAEQTGMLSSVNIEDSNIKYSRLTRKGLELLENTAELIAPPDSFVDRTAWEKHIATSFPYIYEGKKQPQGVWNEAIAKGITDN